MGLKRNLILTGLFLMLSTACLLGEIEYKNNYLTYPKFWNLYNGGLTTKEGLPSLKKSPEEVNKWSATMKLNNYKVIKEFVGKELFFITETSGDPVVRLAPSFYVLKNKKEYLVWWAAAEDKAAAEGRTYLTFSCDGNGKIVGGIKIPVPGTEAVYYAQENTQGKPFQVGLDTPLTISDIKTGLRTDWQHDIPGAYNVGSQLIEGKSGKVVFQRFYLGAKPPEMLLDPARDGWVNGLPAAVKEILNNEFDLTAKMAGNVLEENQYITSTGFMNKVQEYYQQNKDEFDKDPYFLQKNYLKHGDSILNWEVISRGSAEELKSSGGKYVVKNKRSAQDWVIVKISEISEEARLAGLLGQPVRLSAELDARGIQRGSLDWQTVFIDVVQKDEQGKEIGEGDDVRLPLNAVYRNIKNYSGIFENEFIVSKATKKLEVYLKIPGAPDTDKTKPGNTLEQLTVDKVALNKTDTALDIPRVFSTLPEQPVLKTDLQGREYLVYKRCGLGIIVGDRNIAVKNDGHNNYTLEFEINDYADYSGLYSNIFDVTGIDELEIAADLAGNLTKHGQPQAWATNTIEITYFDTNGQVVYAADYGAEKYPKIFLDPAQSKQTSKTFFSIPQERGARYAQIKFHFIKQVDPATNTYDTNNYYTGTSSAGNIIVRPALDLFNKNNFAADNGSFYKHIDGNSLSFSTKGVKVIENLAQQRREVVFENSDENWSSLRTELDIPPEATVLRGQLNLDSQKIEAGLAPWEGFGFFLEADLVDQQGYVFHYSGIPAYQRVGDSLIRLDRISRGFQGKIEYYIPLYHEHLKIKKLYWQLALLGKGKVKLLPLAEGPNPPVVTIELLTGGDEPENPALWAQYGLYSADKDSFEFQKNYQLRLKDNTYNYDSAEVLQEHLSGFLKQQLNIIADLKKIKFGEEKELFGANIKVLPSYARVEREYKLEADVAYLYVTFKLTGSAGQDKYNFMPVLISESGNNLEVSFFQKQGNTWRKITGQDVFDLQNGQVEFLVPLQQTDFKPACIRLIFGDNQGEITFSNLGIYFVDNKAQQIRQTAEGYDFTLDPETLRQVFRQKPATQLALVPLENKDTGVLDPEDTVPLASDGQVRSAWNIADYPGLAELAAAEHQSIKAGKASFSRGSWFYAQGQPFTQVGFTIVGETFHKWYAFRRAEFLEKKTPYWVEDLNPEEKQVLANCTSETQYIKLFIKSQSKLWRKAGVNTIRVHQLLSSWSGLDQKEIDLTVAILKMLQQEEGFLIVFDMLPNTDFTSDFFGPAFKNKRYATNFSYNNDLFKTTLVLPEVREEYVKPALAKLIAVFKRNAFWPDSISYCNETGFTHGFWTVDKRNPQHDPYFSRVYTYYYARFLQNINSSSRLKALLQNSPRLLQNHVQSVQIGVLIDDLQIMADLLKAKQRVKDNAAYVYYNLLRDEVLNSYGFYKPELQDIKENCFKKLAQMPANMEYYQSLDGQVKNLQEKLQNLKSVVARKQKDNAVKLQELLKDPELTAELNSFTARLFGSPMPADYQIPDNLQFEFIDTFEPLNEQQYQQAFFTSFILPVAFTQDINQYLSANAGGRNFSIGLNNDFTRDIAALLGQAYVFVHNPLTELRFNKYAHHPVGGHSMLLNPGQGNVFDSDSDIDMNLALFTPPAAAGYRVQLSETNYTFAGDDDSGQGTWTIFDYLKVIAQGGHFLNFHIGLNNIDKPIINDYFNFGNRPFQVNALGLVGAVALAKDQSADFLTPADFYYNRYTSTLEVEARGLSGIAGTVPQNSTLASRHGEMQFTYRGRRLKTDCAIFCLKPSSKELLIQFYGLERNNRQRNRVGNPNLVHSYGQPQIIYERMFGFLKIKVPKTAVLASITGFTPTGRKITVPKNVYSLENGVFTLQITEVDKEAVSYRVILR